MNNKNREAILQLCNDIINIDKECNRAIAKTSKHETLSLANLRFQRPLRHFYAEELGIFQKDKEYTAGEVVRKGYCCFSGPLPCEPGMEAFNVDSQGRSKQGYLCKNRATLHPFCKAHQLNSADKMDEMKAVNLENRDQKMYECVSRFLNI